MVEMIIPDYFQTFMQGQKLGMTNKAYDLEQRILARDEAKKNMEQDLVQKYAAGDDSAFSQLAAMNPDVAMKIRGVRQQQQATPLVQKYFQGGGDLGAIAGIDPELAYKLKQMEDEQAYRKGQLELQRQQLANANRPSELPADVRTYQFVQSLPPEQQKLFFQTRGVGAEKPLPSTALKMQEEALEGVSLSRSIDTDLATLENQLKTGELDLGPIKNIASGAMNWAGLSTEQSRNYATFNNTISKLRNDILLLAKGTQTEGDAKRALDEIISNINDPQVVAERLAELRGIVQRTVDNKKLQADRIRVEFGKDPIDYTSIEAVASRPVLGVGGEKIGDEVVLSVEEARQKMRKMMEGK